MGDLFTASTFRWLDQINSDRTLSSLALRAAYWISQYNNEEWGYAFFSLEKLARRLEVSRRGLQKAIDSLVVRGHVLEEQGRGRGRANRYRLNLKVCRETGSENVNPSSRFAAPIAPENVNPGSRLGQPGDPENVNSGAGKRERQCPKTRTTVHPHHYSNHFNEEIETPPNPQASSGQEGSAPERRPGDKPRAPDPEPDPSAQGATNGFDEWYRQYPKRVEPRKARKAYAKAIQEGASPAELLRGALRYAAEREGQDPRYTKYPATWLNGGCWADEVPPEPPDRPPERAGPSRNGGFSFTEYALRGIRDHG